MKNIIFLAPPAAGKGTQSEMLVKKYGYVHISTGDLLREEVSKKTTLGQKADELMKQGKYVPDDLILEIISKRIDEEDCLNGYILDGFPRTIVQAEAYDKLLKEKNIDLGVVIYIDIDKDIAMKRACSRMTCPSCGRIYSKYSPDMKPKVEWLCDDCEKELTQRKDDREETFIKRFDEYVAKTMPLYDYYDSKGVLEKITAENDKQKTFEKVVKILEK